VLVVLLILPPCLIKINVIQAPHARGDTENGSGSGSSGSGGVPLLLRRRLLAGEEAGL
jgi:hypothetical protein